MDYIFRWLNLRFLSGEQLTLFAGLGSSAPQLPASPSILPESEQHEGAAGPNLARLAEAVADRLRQMGGPAAGGGIAPEAQSWNTESSAGMSPT